MSSSEVKSPSLVTTSLLTVSIIFPILGTIAVCLRIYACLLKSRRLFLDDYIIILAQVCAWGISIDTFTAASIGGLNYSKGDVPSATIAFLRALWIEGFPLVGSLVLVKISILLFYARIFVTRQFRIATYTFIIVLACWGIAIAIAQLLCASPINAAWDPFAVHPLRYNYNAFSEAFAGMSMVFDIIVLCFPIPAVYRLQMSTRQKLQVMGIFWLGLFCCISSVIRFYYIYCEIHESVASSTVNRYAVVTTAFTWGTIEPNASIISACLPLYGNLFGGSKKLGFYIRSLFSRLASRSSSTGDIIRETPARGYSSVDISGNPSHQRREWQKLDIRTDHVSDIELGDTVTDDQVPLARESRMQILFSRSFVQESA